MLCVPPFSPFTSPPHTHTQGAHRLLLKTTNIKMGVRLGLLKQDHSRALVFEVDSAKMKGE